MELGSKFKDASFKTYEIIKDTSYNISQSNAVKTISRTAGDGINYVASKIFGKNYERDLNDKPEEKHENDNYSSKKQNFNDEYYFKIEDERRNKEKYSSVSKK